jgi:uncharacterized membrane protein YhaH (DUF805 family)
MLGFQSDEFRFLYRTDQGRIDRPNWLRGALPLVVVLGLTSVVLHDVIGYANRDLTQRPFYDPATLATNVYILVYTLTTLLIGISWVNLSAKRFRDRGRPAPLGLAGLLPLAALATGAAHWLQPRVAEVMPAWTVSAFDGMVAIVATWTLLELFDLMPDFMSGRQDGKTG